MERIIVNNLSKFVPMPNSHVSTLNFLRECQPNTATATSYRVRLFHEKPYQLKNYNIRKRRLAIVSFKLCGTDALVGMMGMVLIK